MCGRYFIDDDETIAEMRRIFRDIDAKYNTVPNSDVNAVPHPVATDDIKETELTRPKSGEIYPTDTVPILLTEDKQVQPVLMSWGFPKWQGSGVVINARAETAEEKAMFASSVRQRRCIVPTNGFYEWNQRETGPGKPKYLLRKESERMLYLAGVYASFHKKNGTPYEAFVILTIGANSSVSPLHDRMPLIVEREYCTRWLLDNSFASSLLHTPCDTKMALSLIP